MQPLSRLCLQAQACCAVAGDAAAAAQVVTAQRKPKAKVQIYSLPHQLLCCNRTLLALSRTCCA